MKKGEVKLTPPEKTTLKKPSLIRVKCSYNVLIAISPSRNVLSLDKLMTGFLIETFL